MKGIAADIAQFPLGSTSMSSLLLAHDNNTLSLRYLNDTGARCLDGSPGGYYYRRGVGVDASKFMLIFIGSGWCTSLQSCTARAMTAYGGSASWSKTIHGFGIANSSSERNPDFHRWSTAYIGSCDGAFYLGDRPQPTASGLHFRGRAIADATVDDLVRWEGLGSASALILTGESSGGLAAALSVDRIASMLPGVRDVRAVADAAFFLDRPRCGGDRASLASIAELARMNTTLGCDAWALGWKCASLPHALRTIAAPVFLTQSGFDYSQLGSDGEGLGCTPPGTAASSPLAACGAEGMRRFRAFGEALTAQLSAAISGASPRHRGAIVIGCISHGLTQFGYSLRGEQISLFDSPEWQVPARSGRSISRAIGDWYFGRTNATVHVDQGAWPDNSPCAWLGMPY